MGALAKAIWRNQNLQPVGDAVQGYLQKQQYNRDLQQLAQYQKDYEQGLTGAIQPKQQTVIKDIEAPMLRQENTDNKPFKVGLGVMPGSGISPLAKLTQRQYQPELVQTGMQTLPIETTEDVMPTVQEQRRAVNDQMLKYANNVFALEGLSPEKKQAALSLAQMKANGYMPEEPRYITAADGVNILSADSSGIKVAYHNPKDVKPAIQKPTSYLLNNGDAVKLKNGQYGLQYGYVGEDGKTYVTKTDELSRPPKDTGNGGTGPGSKNTKEDKWTNLVEYITRKRNPYEMVWDKTDPNKINKVPLTKEELQKNQDRLYYTAIGNMAPSAKGWYEREIKGKWKRENLSQVDFLKEAKEAYVNGNIDAQAFNDLMEFSNYRPEIFGNLDTKSYHN